MAFDKATQQKLRDGVLNVLGKHSQAIDLDEVIADVRSSLNGTSNLVKDKDIVMTVHDLLDFQRIVLTSDRRLRLKRSRDNT